MARSKSKDGICHICGKFGKLTKEHIPPKSAFNDVKVLLRKIDLKRSSSEIRYKNNTRQGGNFEYVLCQRCNNNTGGWYANEYVNYVKQCADVASPSLAGNIVNLNIKDMYPARVAKEALSIMCASSSESLSKEHPIIRKLILNKELKAIPKPLRLYTYLRSESGGRSSGQAGIMDNLIPGNITVLIEFSFWPIGWVLMFDDKKAENLKEVTNWLDYNYDHKEDFDLSIPCLNTATQYPLDYRSQAEVEEDREKDV